MLKAVTLIVALAGVLAASGTADAKMRKGRMVPVPAASGFVGSGNNCEALREAASRQDRRGENYYTLQYLQCLGR
jgi:hypothetical protein